MPLRRTSRQARETSQSRALRAAVDEELDAMVARMPADGRTKAQRQRRAAKIGRRIERVMTKARARWDAEAPEWRQMQGAKILADARRYDRAATLPADGGRDLYAVREYGDRTARKATTKVAVDPYGAHRQAAPPMPTTPAPAPGAPPVADESAERRKARRRPRAGIVGYVDPRLIDDDEWED